MLEGGKTKADTGCKKRKAAPPRDPYPVQDSNFESEDDVEDIPADISEDIPEDIPQDIHEDPGNARKKQRLHVKLTEDQEDQLVGIVQQNTHLYDKANKQWLNKHARRQTWQEIAIQMDMPADHLSSWFHSMRTRFGRLKKTKSGHGAPKVTDRERWILRAFDFLSPHIVEVMSRRKDKIAASRPAETANRHTSIKAPFDLEDDLIDYYPGYMPDFNDPVPGPSSQPTITRPVIPPAHPTQPSVPTPRTSRRKASSTVDDAAAPDDLLLRIYDQSIRTIDLLQQSNEIMTTLRPSGVNERISFGQWFTNVLVQLPETVYDSLVDDVFARTKSAKIEARRLQQQQQTLVQQQQTQVQQQEPQNGE